MAFNLKDKVESTTFVCAVWGVVVQLLSHVRVFVIPWAVYIGGRGLLKPLMPESQFQS